MGTFKRDNRFGGNRSGGGGNRYGGGNRFGGGGYRSGGDSRGGFRDRSERQMFDAVCDNCGKACQVPFKPTGEKPVYCRDCYQQMNGDSQGNSNRPDRPTERRYDSAPRRYDNNDVYHRNSEGYSAPTPANSDAPKGPSMKEQIVAQLAALDKKLDQVLAALNASTAEKPAKVAKAKKADAKTEAKTKTKTKPKTKKKSA